LSIAKDKLSGGTFKHIEGELYHFHETKKELNHLRNEILFKNDNHINEQLIQDPTGEKAANLSNDRRIQHLEKMIEAISTVYEGLPDSKKRLVRLLYWTHPQILTWDGIAKKLYISKRQAQRWRKSIVEEIAKRLGWR
jgi:RinA family phage transcriptional activator